MNKLVRPFCKSLKTNAYFAYCLFSETRPLPWLQFILSTGGLPCSACSPWGLERRQRNQMPRLTSNGRVNSIPPLRRRCDSKLLPPRLCKDGACHPQLRPSHKIHGYPHPELRQGKEASGWPGRQCRWYLFFLLLEQQTKMLYSRVGHIRKASGDNRSNWKS